MSFQAPLIRLIDSRLSRTDHEVIATSVSPPYRWYDFNLNQYLWVMDVDLSLEGTRPDSNTVVKAVPIADGSYGVHRVGPGTRLRLRRMELTRTYEIVGLASIVNGQIQVVEVTYTDTSFTVGTATTYGAEYRLLTYDDLGDTGVNGGYAYGTLPYGTLGKYDASNTLQYIIAVP